MYIAYLGPVGMLGSKEGMNPGALSLVPLPAFVQYLPCTGVLAKLNFWVCPGGTWEWDSEGMLVYVLLDSPDTLIWRSLSPSFSRAYQWCVRFGFILPGPLEGPKPQLLDAMLQAQKLWGWP